MKTDKKRYRYIRYMTPEEMHLNTKDWLADLNFTRDEQMFLNRLVQSYPAVLTDGTIFSDSKTLIGRLFEKERDLIRLREQVNLHANQLGLLTDSIDQLTMEKAYRKTHKELANSIGKFMNGYHRLKEELFQVVVEILREGKNKQTLT